MVYQTAARCNDQLLKDLPKGLLLHQRNLVSTIVGGDTNEVDELVIDCTIIGFPRFKVPTRSGAKPGDYVVVSGLFGFAPAGLSILLQKNAVAINENNHNDDNDDIKAAYLESKL